MSAAAPAPKPRAARSEASHRASGAAPKKTASGETASSRAASKKVAAKKTASKKTVSKKVASKKAAARKAPAKKSSARTAKAATPVTKDPKGGLTAAGRAEFERTQGAHLKPGVRKAESEMTPEEMKRKGSWAVRFYGRSGELPPLVDAKGAPTRLALTAAAWGEPVPKTEVAARRIAEKGRKLLARYQRLKEES